jgi:hypothetical protein
MAHQIFPPKGEHAARASCARSKNSSGPTGGLAVGPEVAPAVALHGDSGAEGAGASLGALRLGEADEAR